MFETSVDIVLLSYVMKSRAAMTQVHKLDNRGYFEDAIKNKILFAFKIAN